MHTQSHDSRVNTEPCGSDAAAVRQWYHSSNGKHQAHTKCSCSAWLHRAVTKSTPAATPHKKNQFLLLMSPILTSQLPLPHRRRTADRDSVAALVRVSVTVVDPLVLKSPYTDGKDASIQLLADPSDSANQKLKGFV